MVQRARSNTVVMVSSDQAKPVMHEPSTVQSDRRVQQTVSKLRVHVRFVMICVMGEVEIIQ